MKLFDYQLDGIKFCASKKASLLADEPGLGKTIQTVGVINVCNLKKILIICPASLSYNWKNELNKWLKEPLKIQIVKTGSDTIKLDSNVIIASYGLTVSENILEQIKKIDVWDLVAIDEAHYLKNFQAQRTKIILGKETFLSKAKKIMLLTGTPILNRPIEIYPLLKTLFPQVLGKYAKYQEFTKRYCNGHMTATGWNVTANTKWDVSGSSNETELKEKLKQIMIRRFKKDVIKDLPDKIYQVIDLYSSDSQLQEIINREKLVYDDLQNSGLDLYAAMATVRRELGEAKIPEIVKHVKMLMKSGIEKLVIFAHHKEVIRQLSEELEEYKPVVMTGETSSKERQNVVDFFQNKKEHQIFIGNMISAGVGITLTAASHVVFAEFSWSPAEIQQAIDRCHRIGQKNCVIAQFLTIQNSLDSHMIKTIIDKEFIIDKIVN